MKKTKRIGCILQVYVSLEVPVDADADEVAQEWSSNTDYKLPSTSGAKVLNTEISSIEVSNAGDQE